MRTYIDAAGTAYRNLRQNEKAIGYLEQALAIWRAVKDRQGEGGSRLMRRSR